MKAESFAPPRRPRVGIALVTMEQRKHKRYDLSAVVKFGWELPNGAHLQGTGITRDVSAAGLFVMTDDPPPRGTVVDFEVDLDTSRLDSGLSVRAKGEVKRVEITGLTGPVGGFAVSSRRMKLSKARTTL